MRRITRIGLFVLCGLLTGSLLPAQEPTPGVTVDRVARTVSIDCKIAPRKINDEKFKEIYPIEVIASWAYPKGQKAHETVLTYEAKPSDIHKALESLGLKPGAPVRGEAPKPPQGPAVRIAIEIPTEGGGTRKLPIEKALVDIKTARNLPPLQWRFTGSVMKSVDPEKPDVRVYGADTTGTLITIFPVSDETVFQTNLTMKEEKYVKLDTDKKVLPKEGTPVKLILELPK